MSGALTPGRRLYGLEGTHLLRDGDYGEWDGIWYARTPNGHVGNLAGHEITEHEDGTITVSSSIEVSTSHDGVPIVVWHGYLERGVWRQC